MSIEDGGGPIRDILIVGGGTAGWMSAVYLKQALGPGVTITLVESRTIGTIGVGEASFSSIKAYFDYCQLDEAQWMPACNATYKLAIKFVDWNAAGRPFFHPFERARDVDGVALPEWWLKTRRTRAPFDYSCFLSPRLCDTRRSPKSLDGNVFDPHTRYPYAYHFDAALLADLLRTTAIGRGVRHRYGDVTGVSLGDHGEIASVRLADGTALGADLFVDCTGFRGLLINRALGEPFLSFSSSLLCDRALAMRVPTMSGAGINPYTTATALTSGWVWDIPLYERVGTGYVYSSHFVSDDRAEEELRRHLGPRSDGVDALPLSMRIGRTRNPWVKNCLSIGLSSGFVEPLESTGIFFIQYALAQFAAHFPDRSFHEAVIREYNRIVTDCIDAVRDFLILHYHANDRRDTPFWRAAKDDIEIGDGLRERLRQWRIQLPNADNMDPRFHGFSAHSYYCMLLGLNYEPEAGLPMLDGRDRAPADAAFSDVQAEGERLSRDMPSHREYLDRLPTGAVP